MIKTNDSFSFKHLDWDTDFFDVKSAKAIVSGTLTLKEWQKILKLCEEYTFVSIVNMNSEPINSCFIGMNTPAYLVDTNIQFEKKVERIHQTANDVVIQNSLNRNDEILKLSNFKYSKFIEDPQLEKRNGRVVYFEWLKNAFEKEDKYFAISYNQQSKEVMGYALFSYIKNDCLIELIAVNPKFNNLGIGSKLFMAVQNEAANQNCINIRVGTQFRNLEAINFYQKVGCKQVGCHQIYHLWKE